MAGSWRSRGGARPAAGVLLVWATLSGCDPAPDRLAVAPHDSAGVAIMVGDGADRPLDWRFSTVWSVGLDDDDPVLFQALGAHDVAVGPDGHVYALDEGGRRVLVLGGGGQLVATRGGAVPGAGGLTEPVALAVAPEGTLGVYDRARAGVLRWSADGAVLPFVPVRADFVGPGIALLDGAAAAFVARQPAQAADSGARHALIVYTEGGPAATLATMAAPAERHADFPACALTAVPVTPIFAQQLVWHAAGATIAVSQRPDYSVELVQRGRRTHSIRRALVPEPGSAPLAMREAGDGMHVTAPAPCTVPPQQVVDARGWADTVPIIQAVTLAPDRSLWVLRRAAAGAARIDVFDRDGAYLGTLPAASPFPVGFLADDRVVAIERTDDGVPYLAAYDIIR